MMNFARMAKLRKKRDPDKRDLQLILISEVPARKDENLFLSDPNELFEETDINIEFRNKILTAYNEKAEVNVSYDQFMILLKTYQNDPDVTQIIQQFIKA
jgi:hypothetical protein